MGGSLCDREKFCRSRHFVDISLVICILQAFNCRYLEIFVHDIYIFFLFILKPGPNGIRACLIFIWETLLIVFH